MAKALITITHRVSITCKVEDQFLQKLYQKVSEFLKTVLQAHGVNDLTDLRRSPAFVSDLNQHVSTFGENIRRHVTKPQNVLALTYGEQKIEYVSSKVEVTDFNLQNPEKLMFSYLFISCELTLLHTAGDFLIVALGNVVEELKANRYVDSFCIALRDDLFVSAYQSL